MKRIVVSAASLRMGGAVTIYNQFVSHLQNEIRDNQYFIFVNKVLSQPMIKGVRYYVIDIESRIRRNWFDNQGCKEILDKEGFQPDLVISLQNTGIKSFASTSQLIYYHQSLPFFKHFWNPLKTEERSKFLYKHFYLWFVKQSIGPHSEFVVQTQFIKDNLVRRLRIDESRVHLCFPDVDLPQFDTIKGYPFPKNELSIIYPSLYSPHKAHLLLVDAMYLLAKRHYPSSHKLRLYFTVEQEEAPELLTAVKKNGLGDRVVFLGKLSYATTLSLYKSAAALLFPSTIETLGLPLIEAASFGLPIIAADVEYAREVLEGYKGVVYVQANNAKAWAQAIEQLVDYAGKRYPSFSLNGKAGWKEFFSLF